MQNAEIELKFPVDDSALLESLLPGLGFHLDTPRTFEQNTLYDTPTRSLRASKQLLRLRRYGSLWTLTHKRQPAESADSTLRYKVRIETETHLDDGPAMEQIFQQLGYGPVFRYEKFRTEWSHAVPAGQNAMGVDAREAPEDAPVEPVGHLVLDETPIGIYAELEGPMGWIDTTLAELGVDPATCITESYGKLFLAWKERTGSPANDLTFDEVEAGVVATAG
jgi:adenylate cyclase class 2